MDNARVTKITMDYLVKHTRTAPRITRQEDLVNHLMSLNRTITVIQQNNLDSLLTEELTSSLTKLFNQIAQYLHVLSLESDQTDANLLLTNRLSQRAKNMSPVYEDSDETQEIEGDTVEEYSQCDHEHDEDY